MSGSQNDTDQQAAAQATVSDPGSPQETGTLGTGSDVGDSNQAEQSPSQSLDHPTATQLVNPFVPAYIEDKSLAEANFFRPATQPINPAFPHHSELPPKNKITVYGDLPKEAFIQPDASAQEVADLRFFHGYTYDQILWLMQLPKEGGKVNGRVFNKNTMVTRYAHCQWWKPLQLYLFNLDSKVLRQSGGDVTTIGGLMKKIEKGGKKLHFPAFFPKPEVLSGQMVFGLGSGCLHMDTKGVWDEMEKYCIFEEIPSEEPSEEVTSIEEPSEEVPSKEESSQEVPSGEVPSEEAPTEEVSSKEVPSEELSEEMPLEEGPALKKRKTN